MKLVDIVKKLPWPDGAAVVVQDCTFNGTGLLKYCRTDLVAQLKYIDEQRSMRWATNENPVRWAASELADDHDEAVITHADWLEAQEQVGSIEATHSEAAMNELPYRFAWLLWARAKSRHTIKRVHNEVNARSGVNVANIIAARVAACEREWLMAAVTRSPWLRLMK